MRGVGREGALGFEGRVHAIRHPVEGAPESPHLVVTTGQRGTRTHVARGDPVRRARDAFEWLQAEPRHQPHGDAGQDEQADRGELEGLSDAGERGIDAVEGDGQLGDGIRRSVRDHRRALPGLLVAEAPSLALAVPVAIPIAGTGRPELHRRRDDQRPSSRPRADGVDRRPRGDHAGIFGRVQPCLQHRRIGAVGLGSEDVAAAVDDRDGRAVAAEHGGQVTRSQVRGRRAAPTRRVRDDEAGLDLQSIGGAVDERRLQVGPGDAVGREQHPRRDACVQDHEPAAEGAHRPHAVVPRSM